MANNKTTYVLEIDAEVSQLKSKLENTKTALDRLGNSGFSMDLNKKINSILGQLEKLQRKAAQPIDSKATFQSLEKGFGGIIIDAKNLLNELGKISNMTSREKLSLLPEDEAKKLKEAIGAVQNYTKAVEKAEKARIRAQERRKVDRDAIGIQVTEAKSSHKKAVSQLNKATGKGTVYGDAAAIIAQSEAAKKAQKEIDQLEKQLKKYQKRLEELNKIENKTTEQNAELATIQSNIKSVGGKIGARKKVVNKAPDEKTLTAAKNTIEELSPSVEVLEQQVAQAEKEVTRLENSLSKLDEAIKNNSLEITSSQAEYKVLYEQAKKLGISLEGVTEDVNPYNVRILTERMRELVSQGIDPLDNAIDEVVPDIKELGNVAVQIGDKIAGAAESYGSLADNQTRINNLKENIRQFIGWAGASKVLSAALRNAFQDIKELDTAMTEIAVVTDFDIGDMWEQMPQYTERANELGLAITEVYEASALYYQQGLDTNEMVALSNETLKMAKIAGLDAAEATDRMTAALRGFNMELDEASAQKVADVYSELAAITASDVDEISSAMTKTASIASSAGMEFETTAAFLSQIIETTRESAETAGTAMKTVIARFQELKKSPDEIGEIDGEMVDANAIEGALRSVGVSLRDAGGQFRELDEVFLELSSKWDGLDKNTQRYIATIAAGSRQQSRFIAMMQDYGRTQELVAAANDSAGASQRQYEKTLDSIDTKLKQLDNAWTEFSTGLMNSDLIKFAVDFLTSLLNALNKVTQGFEGFTGSFSKISTMVAIFQTAKTVVNKFFDNIVEKVYKSAVRAGENIAEGTKDGIQKKEKVGNRLGGYTQIKEGFGSINRAKGIRNSDKYQNAKGVENFWGSQYKEYVKYFGEESDEALSALDDYNAAIKERREIEAEAIKESSKGWDSISQGIQTASQAVTMLGVGIGVVGQMFQEAGLEEVGEGFQKVGNIITFIGGAIGALVPIVSLLGTTVTVAGEKMTIAGYMAQAAWWPLLLIGLAIASIIATIILVANAIKKASPEYKLEQAQKAADKASEAADRAANSYENLVNTFEGLEQGYEALKDLTRGTEEWNNAVKDINNSVLDLIAEYPELAKFVEGKDGVLTINMDDSNVQQILRDAETSAIVAKNSATLANISVAKAEDDLAYKNLDDDAKFNLGGANAAYGGAMAGTIAAGAGAGAGIGALVGTVVPVIGNAVGAAVGAGIGAIGGLIGGFFTGDAAKDAALEDTQNTTEALAKAIADGAIIDNGSGYDVKDYEKLAKYGIKVEDLSKYYAQVGDSTEALRDFGEQLLQTSAQEEAAFGAVAASAYQLANTLSMTEEEQDQAINVVDDASVKKMYEDSMNSLGDTDFTNEKTMENNSDLRQKRDEAIRAQYGADARIEGNKVTYRDAEGKQQTEELTNDELKAIIANNMSTQEAKKAVEMAPQTINYVIDKMGYKENSAEAKAIEAAVKDQEGGNLTAEEAKTLTGMDEDRLRKVYQGMTEEQKNVFGSEDEYIKKIKGAGEIAAGAFEKAGSSAEKIGLTLSEQGTTAAEKFANTFGFMTSDMAKGFTSKMEEVWKVSGEEGVKQIQNAYNTLLEGQENETAQAITARMNAIDWTNTEALLAFQIELEEEYGYTRDEAKNMTDAMEDAAKATSNLTTTVEIFGDFYHATKRLNAALEKTADLQWKYERMLKNGAKTTELAANLEEQKQSILNTGYEALAAYNAAKDDQATTYAKGVNLPGVGKDVTQYVKFDENTGTYNLTELQRQLNAGVFGAENTDSRKAVEDYISELTEANELAEDQLESAKDAYEQLEELNEQAEEAYWSLYEQIGDLIISELEEEISIQQDILDATQDANEKLIDKLQEQIDEERQARKNKKVKENISDLYSQAAYLGMDSSGTNALQLLDLEKQIGEEEEAYQDSLIDQSIQQLQDANEKAADQRERQISIAESQLEMYRSSIEFENTISQQLEQFMQEIEDGVDVQDTEIGKRLRNSEFFADMHPHDEKAFWAGLTENGALANYFKNTESNTNGDGENSIAELLNSIDTNIANSAAETTVSGNYAAAQEKAKNILDTTRFAYSLPDFNTYYDDKGNFDASSAKADIINTNNAYTTAETLSKRNSEATSTFQKYSAAEGLESNKILSEEEFYNKINSGETVRALGGEKEYTSEQLQSSLQQQKTDGDYQDYLEASIGARYGTKTQLQHLEDLFSEKMQKTSAIRQGDEVAFRGWETIENREKNLVNAYLQAGGSIDKLKTIFSEQVYKDGVSGAVTLSKANANDWMWGNLYDRYATFTGTIKSNNALVSGEWNFDTEASTYQVAEIEKLVGNKPEENWMAMVNGTLFCYSKGAWREITKNDSSKKWYSSALKGYKTGGLADFTGPAWLDGTPSRPEYILNAAQTERFFSLVDILEGYDTDKNNNKSSGDNYFDIEINVEKLENDYDVEKVAEKIRNMIYSDATYRNVNAINHIR